MAVLVDSDILIEVTRARVTAILGKWSELSRESSPIFCSPVTVAELWHGALPSENRVLTAIFASLQCVPIDMEIGVRAGQYLQQFSKSHNVELGDSLIAATATIHKLELWTRNRRHYPMKDVVFY